MNAMKKTDMPATINVETVKFKNNIFQASTATVVGNVSIKEESSIWYGAVIRGDINNISIGRRTNIQDNAVIHVENDIPCTIGSDVTIGHGAIIHACTIEDAVLIGMGAIILNGAVLKKGAVIAAGAVVKEREVVDNNSMWAGVPAKKIKTYESEYYKVNVQWAAKYVKLAKIHQSAS